MCLVKELPFPPLDWNKRLTPEEKEKRRKQDAEMDARDAAITAAAIARRNGTPAANASVLSIIPVHQYPDASN